MVYDTEFLSPLTLAPERTIVCDGFSKAYSMTGWRIGWMVVPDHLIKPIENMINNITSCTAEFTQYAALAALRGNPDQITEMVQMYKERRDYVVRELNTMTGITCRVPDGAFYAFPNIKQTGMTSREMAEYLLDHGVALLDGTAFGHYGEGYLRISYATSMGELQEAMRRMNEALLKI
jgi:aspartate/methionine/tyrosine aminotransferase